MTQNPQSEKTVMMVDEQPISGKYIVEILRRKRFIPEVVKEIILEKSLSDIVISDDDEADLLRQFCKERNIKNEEDYAKFLDKKHFDKSIVKEIITRPEKVLKYREERWGPIAKSLYLKHKDRYDLVKYKRLQFNNPDVMQEIFFRLKDKEESWISLARQLNKGNPNAKAEIGPLPVSAVEEPIIKELRQKGPGKISQPISIGDMVVLVELIEFQPSNFNKELRNQILKEEFESWLEEESSKILKKVDYPA